MNYLEENDIKRLETLCSVEAGPTCRDLSETLKPIFLTLILTVVTSISTAGVLFGLIFWILIPDYRMFTHFAFLNILLANTAFLAGIFAQKQAVVFNHIIYYIFLVFTHWLIVVSGLFYFKIAKVFKVAFNHAYIKSTAVCWLLPGVWTTIGYFTKIEYISYVCMVLVLLNFLMYVRVLYALCTAMSPCEYQRITFATFAFICTGMVMYANMMVQVYKISELSVNDLLMFCFCYGFTVMAINIFFLLLKVHREKWAEYQSRETNNFL